MPRRTGYAAVGIYGESLHLVGFDPAVFVAGGIVGVGLHDVKFQV